MILTDELFQSLMCILREETGRILSFRSKQSVTQLVQLLIPDESRIRECAHRGLCHHLSLRLLSELSLPFRYRVCISGQNACRERFEVIGTHAAVRLYARVVHGVTWGHHAGIDVDLDYTHP